jgi:hypothetical protein
MPKPQLNYRWFIKDPIKQVAKRLDKNRAAGLKIQLPISPMGHPHAANPIYRHFHNLLHFPPREPLTNDEQPELQQKVHEDRIPQRH